MEEGKDGGREGWRKGRNVIGKERGGGGRENYNVPQSSASDSDGWRC